MLDEQKYNDLKEQHNNDNKYDDKFVLSKLMEGNTRDDIAKMLGHKNYRSIDMYMRRKGYIWNSEKQLYVIKVSSDFQEDIHDINNDKICDYNCDTNNDNICDLNCYVKTLNNCDTNCKDKVDNVYINLKDKQTLLMNDKTSKIFNIINESKTSININIILINVKKNTNFTLKKDDVILLENSNNKTLQTISIPAQTKFKYELNLSEVDPELYILIENK